MELYFMAVAILLLTLVASYAIRRAEEEMIERHDLDRSARNMPSSRQIDSEEIDSEEASGTKARA